MTVSAEQIRETLRKLNVRDSSVCIHGSLRSFGQVVGGADTIIDAFLEEGNTVMAPTFSISLQVPPPPDFRPANNAFNYDAVILREHDRVFDPESNHFDRESMGAIPGAVLARSGRRRGNHPTHSFSALGPLADRLVASQSRLNIYGAMQSLMEAEGYIVLMGVGFDRLTLLHMAENRAGRRSFIRWVNDGAGKKIMCPVGSCSVGFTRLTPILQPYVREVAVGQSRWIVGKAQTLMEKTAEAIRADPEITRCRPECMSCRHAIEGGPEVQLI